MRDGSAIGAGICESAGMTLGHSPTQADIFRSTTSYCEGRVAPDSIYAMLHRECHRLFPDTAFADLFPDVGRRSVPPMIVATVMVLQRLEGLQQLVNVCIVVRRQWLGALHGFLGCRRFRGKRGIRSCRGFKSSRGFQGFWSFRGFRRFGGFQGFRSFRGLQSFQGFRSFRRLDGVPVGDRALSRGSIAIAGLVSTRRGT